MHCAAYHFIKALGIPSLIKTKKALKTRAAEDDDDDMEAGNVEDEDLEDDDADVDVSMSKRLRMIQRLWQQPPLWTLILVTPSARL